MERLWKALSTFSLVSTTCRRDRTINTVQIFGPHKLVVGVTEVYNGLIGLKSSSGTRTLDDIEEVSNRTCLSLPVTIIVSLTGPGMVICGNI